MNEKALFAVAIVCDIIAVGIFAYMETISEFIRILIAVLIAFALCVFLPFAIYCKKHWND